MILRVLSKIEMDLVDFIYDWNPNKENIKEIPVEELDLDSEAMSELADLIKAKIKVIENVEIDSGVIYIEIDLRWLQERYGRLEVV